MAKAKQSRVKDIVIKVIPASIANPFVKLYHYSHKVVPNSQLHFGAFLDGKLHGVISLGPSTDKRKLIHLVEGTGWNEFIEINRMAFDDYLPKNSESRALGVVIRMLKKKAPHLKWIVSFADATQCGDGTIYRAVGFLLTGIKKNNALHVNPKTGEVIHKITAYHKYGSSSAVKNWPKKEGYQLRYIYLLKKGLKLTVPVIPYSKIDELGIGMYKGRRISIAERRAKKEGIT